MAGMKAGASAVTAVAVMLVEVPWVEAVQAAWAAVVKREGTQEWAVMTVAGQQVERWCK